MPARFTIRTHSLRWIAFRDAEKMALKALHSGNGEIGWQAQEEGGVDLVRQRARSLTDYFLTER